MLKEAREKILMHAYYYYYYYYYMYYFRVL